MKWFPWFSALLLAAWIPLQAAGCCKLVAVLGLQAKSAAKDAPMAADHACCKKAAAEAGAALAEPIEVPSDAAPAEDCSKGDKGCCLKVSSSASPGLASTPIAPDLPVLASLLPASGESLPVPAVLPSSALRAEGGPPLYLAQLRLLI